MRGKKSKSMLSAFIVFFMLSSVVVAGEIEKNILETLENLGVLADYPASPEFSEALSDCQELLILAEMDKSHNPEFLNLAEKTFFLFKALKDLFYELESIDARERKALSKAEKDNASEEDKLIIERDHIRMKGDIMFKMVGNQAAAERSLDDLYSFYKEKVLEKNKNV